MSSETLTTRKPRLARHVRMSWDEARKRHVLLVPEGVLVLNGTGATILGLCDGERSIAAIVEELRVQYNKVVPEEVEGYLTRLAERGLIEMVDV